MKVYSTDKIHNICLAGQRGCGKTSLADVIAYCSGINSRIGRVDDGSSLLDYTDSEIARKSSVTSKLLAVEWQGTKINLLDCPGHADFVGELLSSAHVSDAAGFVLDATSGVEVGTQMQWKQIPESCKARFLFVNKMDKENADWQTSMDSIRSAFGKSGVAVQLPVGQAESFKGLVDLLHMKAYSFDEEGNRAEIDIPPDLSDEAVAEREKLVEVAAESDDALLEKFFEGGTLSDEDVLKGLRIGIKNGTLYPVLFGSAERNMGTKVLLDFITEYLPTALTVGSTKVEKSGSDDMIELNFDSSSSPVAFIFKTVSEGHLGEMSFFRTISGTLKGGMELTNQQSRNAERIAQVFSFQGKNRIELESAVAGDIGVLVKLKSTHTGNTLSDKSLSVIVPPVTFPNPVMDAAVKAKTKGDEDKISAGLAKLHEEDPTFRFVADPNLKQQVLYAQGSTHIDIISEKLKSRYGVEIELSKPKIPYRETIRGKTEKQYKHKKQSGGRGQYGDVYIRIEPNARGGGFEFIDAIKGGVIPSKYVPAVEKGVIESMEKGGLAGAPVVDVKVTLYFGSQHDVDSSDMAFKIAAMMAFKEGFLECKPVLLEPVFDLEVLVPNDFTGDVMGDLSSRRGKIAGMDPEGTNQRIRAKVPQAELYQYSVDLRSMTQGQGAFSTEFSHYEEVPHDATQKVIEEAKSIAEAESK